jgi:hypothetical protein
VPQLGWVDGVRELYQLGAHRYLCADATDPKQIAVFIGRRKREAHKVGSGVELLAS